MNIIKAIARILDEIDINIDVEIVFRFFRQTHRSSARDLIRFDALQFRFKATAERAQIIRFLCKCGRFDLVLTFGNFRHIVKIKARE